MTNNAKLEKDLQSLCSSSCTKKEFSLDERGLKETETHAVAIMLAHNHSLHKFSFVRNLPDDRGTNVRLPAPCLHACQFCVGFSAWYLQAMAGRKMFLCSARSAPLLTDTQHVLQRLMAAMRRNKTLKSLDLGYCYLGKNGGREVAGQYKRSRSGLPKLQILGGWVLCLLQLVLSVQQAWTVPANPVSYREQTH